MRIIKLLDKHKVLFNGKSDFKDRYFITEDEFERFTEMYGISFPDEIIYFYSRIGIEKENDLTRSMRSALKKRWLEGRLLLQISPVLALEIIERYQSLPEKEKNRVIENTKLPKKTEILNYHATVEEYLLTEIIADFDHEEKKFPSDFINQIASNYWGSNELIYSFVMWAHCGGCGSIILNTDRKGYDGGQMYGHYPKVIYDGKEYEYFANYWGKMEKHHLEEYEDYLIKTLKEPSEM
ncbi:hypothetical protein [Lewinella sp. LCG006]|uniref:hypothetical protein n=1 Tax=Lewinella sp. LCG006 TaxID=3231911 RepID=UPI003460F531